MSYEGQFTTPRNGTQPHPDPKEDATTRTRKQWSALVSEWDIPFWLSFDHLEDADSERIVRYFTDSFRNQRGEEVYMADTYGTWRRLQDGSRSCQAVVRTMIVMARKLAAADLWHNVLDVSPADKAAYESYLANDMKLASSHVRAVALQLRQRIMGADVAENVAIEDFDNRNDHPVLPLAYGGGLDLTTGQTIADKELSERMLLSRGWALPMLDKKILESQTEGAKAMRHAIEFRFGHTLIRRIARHTLGISKSIDTILAPSDWGKGTLISIMERAFPGMVGRVESGRALSTGGDKFSVVTSLLSDRLWVFVDESGSRVDKPIHGSILKTWIDDLISVERKGFDRVSKRRLGTAIFTGYDFPAIDMSDQGMSTRFQWAIKMEDDPMLQEERDLLMTPDSIEFFRQSIMGAAVSMWKEGDIESCTHTAETRQTVEEFASSRSNPLAQALRMEYELGDGKRDWVASANIQLVLEEAADGEKMTGALVRDAMSSAFHSPTVVPDRKTIEGTQIRVWMGIKEKQIS